MSGLRMFLAIFVAVSLVPGGAGLDQPLNSFVSLSGISFTCPANLGTCGVRAQGPARSEARAARGEAPKKRNGSGSFGASVSLTGAGLNFARGSIILQRRDLSGSNPAGIVQPAPVTIAGIPAGAVLVNAFVWAGGSSSSAGDQTITCVSFFFGGATC